MLLRNRERHRRSKFALAIIASISLVFVGSMAIFQRTQAGIDDVAYAESQGLVLGIRANNAPSAESCSDTNSPDYYGYGVASTYEKSCFFKRYNDLGALGSFHLIGLNSISNVGWSGAIYGNITTRSTSNIQKLGVNNLPEINYISDSFSAGYNFFSNSGESVVVFGDSIIVRPKDNVNIEIGATGSFSQYQIGGWSHTFWQDYEAKFLDMDALRTDAIQYNVDTYTKYTTLDPNDPDNANIAMGADAAHCTGPHTNPSTSEVICDIEDNEKVSFVNINASDWISNDSIPSITINNAGPKKTFLINIDAKGRSSLNFNGGVNVNLSSADYSGQPLQCFNASGVASNVGTSINGDNFNCYSETAETNIIFNIYDSTNTTNNYQWSGTISGSRIYGMLVAPSATISNVQAIRGTVVADTISNVGSTYQSNFYGRLVVFPTVTVQHRNPDGTQFTYGSVDTSDQVYTITEMEYTTSPIDLGDDVSYTITLAEGSAPANGPMPDSDIVVTYVYTK
ncbi:hypothetical protein J5500_01375, partial [Candidatus Saccharibacteria bacterium]|nr:hypothetical protein [Candidatus Saccharibacteria bacterium]